MSCQGPGRVSWLDAVDPLGFSHTPILRIDRKWSEKEKTSVQIVSNCQSVAEDAAWPASAMRDAPGGKSSGRVCRYLWPPAADPFYTLSPPTADALLTSLTGVLAASFPSTVPASAALLVVVALFLMRPLNFFFTAECFAMLSREWLLNQLSCFFPLFLKKNLWTCTEGHMV